VTVWPLNNEMEEILKEASLAWIDVTSRHLPRWLRKSTETSVRISGLWPIPREYQDRGTAHSAVYEKVIFILLKFSSAIYRVSVDLKSNVTDISISVIRVGVMHDCMSLVYIPVYQIDASSCWCTMQQGGAVKCCGHPSDPNLSPRGLTWCIC
jgi:hypothetical protein